MASCLDCSRGAFQVRACERYAGSAVIAQEPLTCAVVVRREQRVVWHGPEPGPGSDHGQPRQRIRQAKLHPIHQVPIGLPVRPPCSPPHSTPTYPALPRTSSPLAACRSTIGPDCKFILSLCLHIVCSPLVYVSAPRAPPPTWHASWRAVCGTAWPLAVPARNHYAQTLQKTCMCQLEFRLTTLFSMSMVMESHKL